MDVLESLVAQQVESLVATTHFYVREYGWCVVDSIDVPPFGPDWTPVEPSTITLTEPKGPDADITELRFPPGAQVLIAMPVEMPAPPDEPPAEEPPTEPPGHFVWRDAGSGEYVTEEYADANPDTTVKEWVLDDE